MRMFEKLKRRSLKKLTEKYILERDYSQVNSKVKTIGFLVDEQLFQDSDTLYEFYKPFNLVPKDIKVFSFLEVKKKLPSLRQNQVQCKDFNWKGEMHNPNAEEFLNTEFDVLIGYYKGNHEFLDAMLSKSKARFKVGFDGADERLFDLLISVPLEDVKLFQKELKKYLTILNKL